MSIYSVTCLVLNQLRIEAGPEHSIRVSTVDGTYLFSFYGHRKGIYNIRNHTIIHLEYPEANVIRSYSSSGTVMEWSLSSGVLLREIPHPLKG